jgi:hypothetical protein
MHVVGLPERAIVRGDGFVVAAEDGERLAEMVADDRFEVTVAERADLFVGVPLVPQCGLGLALGGEEPAVVAERFGRATDVAAYVSKCCVRQ